ncbi:MAG: hypothetical protein IPN27_07395 [Cellvibrionales bacterium]|nr:hypothetical protein [Cellvibrionales bacterium]
MIFADMSPAASQPEQSLVVYLEARLRDSQTNKILVKSIRAGTGSAAGKDKGVGRSYEAGVEQLGARRRYFYS